MARLCLSLLIWMLSAYTLKGQMTFQGECGMSHPCSQICNRALIPGRVKCECESGHILAANGFLCISEKTIDDFIDIDVDLKDTATEVRVEETSGPAVKECRQGSGALETVEGGSGDEEQGSGCEPVELEEENAVKEKILQDGVTEKMAVVVVTEKMAVVVVTEEIAVEVVTEETAVKEASCDDVKCSNKGVCYVDDEMMKAMCHCHLGFEGDRCEQAVDVKFPSFRTHSFMEFPTPLGLYRTFQISVDFKPETLDGLMLFAGEKDDTTGDYFSIALVGGKVQFRYYLGGTSPAVITSTVALTLGKWHTATINRDNWSGWIQVDDEQPVKGKSMGLYSKLTLRSPLYLGGHGNYTSLSEVGVTAGFSGCVERLVINNADQDMRQAPRGYAVAGIDVGECSSGLCDEGMCNNGGSCVAQSASRYLCLCPLGTAGATCERDVLLHIPSFNGSSHLVHKSLGKNHLSFLEIEVVFRPHELTGVLLYSGQKLDRAGDFVSLGMSDGHVEFRFDCGSGPAVLRTTEPVTLNEWHFAVASRTAREGTLQVDKRPIIEGMAEGAFTQLVFAGDLYIGGVEDRAHVAKKSGVGSSFIGDIQKVIINDKPLDLIDDALRGANVINADHPCIDQPCHNQADCIAQHASYSCQCPLWYEGITCKEVIEESVEVPSFQGSSYLRFTSDWVLRRIGGRSDDIHFEFRTWSSEGLIFWVGRDVMTTTSDYMALGLDNGMMKWSFNLGGGPVFVSTNKTYNDGSWHTVSVRRDGPIGILIIDGLEDHTATAPGPMTSLDINNGLYLGGMRDIAELSLKRYTVGLLGCLKNVRLDNTLLDLYNDPSEGRNINHCA